MGAVVLHELLSKLPKFSDDRVLVGFDTKDDSAVYKITDELAAIQTVDFFPPIVDDAFKFGRIAAVNALSDIYAMGVHPQFATNIFCFNSVELELEVAADILAGGADAIVEAGAVLVGGQTLEDTIPKYGLCVTAFAPIEKILTNSGATPGDVIILTKSIGTASVMGAMRANAASADIVDAAIDQMCRLNKYAIEAMDGFGVSACTDVTGFGLLGHLMEMANASDVTVEINYSAVPKLRQAEEFAKAGFTPCEAKKNQAYVRGNLSVDGLESFELALITEPQTSGGLLICIDESSAQALLECLYAHDPDSAVIGRVAVRDAGAIRLSR